MTLNTAQARAIRATFTQVSELLDDVAKVARGDLTSFDRTQPDLSPAESRRLTALVSSIRSHMLEALQTLGIPGPEPETSARWSAQTAFLFAKIALSELSAEGIRGYGAVGPEDGDLLAALAGELSGMVERARDLLRGVDPASLDAEVARVQGPAGDALRAVWSFARRHELVDVFSDVAAVAERAAAPAADVGVFGRTNAGKSSLINALVGQSALPVGAVPMTAVPLRLARGPAALRVRRETGADDELPLKDLARFDLETLGSGDSEVVALDAFVPGAPAGLRLIDTPGLGSYASPVAARTFEWLPRCDLGLLLLPAGAVLEAEDVAVARGLVAAGVDLRVLLSKADLLAEPDLARSTDHLHRELERHLGRSPGTIIPVSALAGRSSDGMERLRGEVLGPLADEHERSSGNRIRKRLQHLVTVVEAAFEGRAARTSKSDVARRSAIERVRRRIDAVLRELSMSGAEAVEQAADTLAGAWREEGGEIPVADVEARLAEPAERTLGEVRKILNDAARTMPDGDDAGPEAMPPLFTFHLSDSTSTVAPGAVGARIFPRARALRRLGSEKDGVEKAYRRYADRLRVWSTAMLTAMEETGAAPEADGSSAAEVEALRTSVSALGT